MCRKQPQKSRHTRTNIVAIEKESGKMKKIPGTFHRCYPANSWRWRGFHQASRWNSASTRVSPSRKDLSLPTTSTPYRGFARKKTKASARLLFLSELVRGYEVTSWVHAVADVPLERRGCCGLFHGHKRHFIEKPN